MSANLQDLIVVKTRDELLAEELVVAQSEGLETTAWQSGSVIRTILVIVAAMISAFSAVIAEPIRGGFGDLLATLAWAKVWAKQQFDVEAIEAEAATGTINLINVTAVEYVHAIGDLIVAHAVTGKLYRNANPVTVLANDTTEDVDVAATEVGTRSNAAPGAVTVLVGPTMDGVTVTNPAAILGTDAETIGALVTRSREKLAALSPLGPKEAYNYIAKTPEFAATSTAITRATTFENPLTGAVTVYIATAEGAPTGGDVTIVQTALETWAEPWCTSVTAVAATEVAVNVTYEVWVKSSLTLAQIETAIEDALAVYFATIPIGGTLLPPATGYVYVDALKVIVTTATLNATPIGAVMCDVILPTVDAPIASAEVAILGDVSGVVHFL